MFSRLIYINSGTIHASNVSATVTSSSPSIIVIDNLLTFGGVPAGVTITSFETFTLKINRRYPFNESALSWVYQNNSRIVDFSKVTPDIIHINEMASVTVTAQLGADPQLLMDQVYLLRLDENGNTLQDYGQLSDD